MLKGLWDDIKGAFKDITTLDVVTVTGTFDISKTITDNDKVDFDALMDVLKTAPSPAPAAGAPAQPPAGGVDGQAKFSVLAISRLKLDCDAFVFVKSNLNESEKILVQAHSEMVKAAQETRYGVVRMVAELFKNTPPTT